MAMNDKAVLLPLFLLLISATLCAESYPSGVRLMGYYMVPQGSGFSIDNFTLGSSPAYAIVSGGEVYSIVVPNFPFIEPTPLSDVGQIEGALRGYYSSQGYSPDAVLQFSSIHAGIRSVNGTYKPGEAKCRVLLGTDRNPCTDFDSCLRACYSVTSFCQPFALGAGRPFVDTMLEFENNSRRLEAAYAQEARAYAAFSANRTNETASSYLSSLVGINRAATAAASSQLFDGYSFCFAPDYSLPVITNLQLWAQTYYQNASRFYSVAETAKRVQNRTLVGLARKKLLEVAPANAPAAYLPGPNSTPQNPQAAAVREPKPLLTTDFLVLSALVLAVLSAAALCVYLVLKRRKHP